jgi:hypothetical protein
MIGQFPSLSEEKNVIVTGCFFREPRLRELHRVCLLNFPFFSFDIDSYLSK